MIKPKKDDNKEVEELEQSDSQRILALLENISRQQGELQERVEELEKSTTNADASIHMMNFLYNTDDKHLPELTRIPIQAVRPHALGMMLESLFDPEVQSGEVPLSRILRNAQFRLMRSVGGIHLGRGVRLAEQQAEAEQEQAAEIELGGGGE